MHSTGIYITIFLRAIESAISPDLRLRRNSSEFYTHIHMSAGNDKGKVFGGHSNRAVVSATCGMVIHIINGKVDRRYDEDVGLNLLEF